MKGSILPTRRNRLMSTKKQNKLSRNLIIQLHTIHNLGAIVMTTE